MHYQAKQGEFLLSLLKIWDAKHSANVICSYCLIIIIIANEPAERRHSAGKVAENSAARRILYAEKFSNNCKV